MSRWKAGQCVTIEGKRYRVTKLNRVGSCIYCAFTSNEGDVYPCSECIDGVPSLLPHCCYLKEIKP